MTPLGFAAEQALVWIEGQTSVRFEIEQFLLKPANENGILNFKLTTGKASYLGQRQPFGLIADWLGYQFTGRLIDTDLIGAEQLHETDGGYLVEIGGYGVWYEMPLVEDGAAVANLTVMARYGVAATQRENTVTRIFFYKGRFFSRYE